MGCAHLEDDPDVSVSPTSGEIPRPQSVNRTCKIAPNFMGVQIDQTLNDRLHVPLAISIDACFSIAMLKPFPLFPPCLLCPAHHPSCFEASFILCIFERVSILSCAMVLGVSQMWVRLWGLQACPSRRWAQVRSSSQPRQSH